MANQWADATESEIAWTPALIKRLRGKRTQLEFGELLGVPKNTVWRWESGRVAPSPQHAEVLSKLARELNFLKDWKLVGSVTLLGDLGDGSRAIRNRLAKSLLRSADELSE
jgi:transcriptional regulator with XRE-family HTH domain